MVLRGPVKTGPRRLLRSTEPRVRVSLTRDAEEAIWRAAEILSEGEIRHVSGEGPAAHREVYFGSTMITVALDTVTLRLGEETPDAHGARLVLELAQASLTLRAQIGRLARTEAARRVPGRSFERMSLETRFRVVASRIEVDVDVEGTLVPLRSRRARGG